MSFNEYEIPYSNLVENNNTPPPRAPPLRPLTDFYDYLTLIRNDANLRT
jgi:hypothetical protein